MQVKVNKISNQEISLEVGLRCEGTENFKVELIGLMYSQQMKGINGYLTGCPVANDFINIFFSKRLNILI